MFVYTIFVDVQLGAWKMGLVQRHVDVDQYYFLTCSCRCSTNCFVFFGCSFFFFTEYTITFSFSFQSIIHPMRSLSEASTPHWSGIKENNDNKPDAVSELLECRLPMCKVGSVNPSQVKLMTYKIDRLYISLLHLTFSLDLKQFTVSAVTTLLS